MGQILNELGTFEGRRPSARQTRSRRRFRSAGFTVDLNHLYIYIFREEERYMPS